MINTLLQHINTLSDQLVDARKERDQLARRCAALQLWQQREAVADKNETVALRAAHAKLKKDHKALLDKHATLCTQHADHVATGSKTVPELQARVDYQAKRIHDEIQRNKKLNLEIDELKQAKANLLRCYDSSRGATANVAAARDEYLDQISKMHDEIKAQHAEIKRLHAAADHSKNRAEQEQHVIDNQAHQINALTKQLAKTIDVPDHNRFMYQKLVAQVEYQVKRDKYALVKIELPASGGHLNTITYEFAAGRLPDLTIYTNGEQRWGVSLADQDACKARQHAMTAEMVRHLNDAVVDLTTAAIKVCAPEEVDHHLPPEALHPELHPDFNGTLVPSRVLYIPEETARQKAVGIFKKFW
jgi:hypothetical protein